MYGKRYRCNTCGSETTSQEGLNDPSGSQVMGSCVCGGTYSFIGEEYDQDFIDQQNYERQQDREYEERHRRDY